jgi:hypothetical protein
VRYASRLALRGVKLIDATIDEDKARLEDIEKYKDGINFL